MSLKSLIWSKSQLVMTACCAFVLFTCSYTAQAAGIQGVQAPLAPGNDSQALSPSPVLSSAQRATSLNSVYLTKGFNAPYYNFADTVTQDDGDWRSTLARYGIGLIEANIQVSAFNIGGTPSESKGQQVYWGQKPSFWDTNYFYLTYDLSQFGIPSGQLQFSLLYNTSTWQPYQVNAAGVFRLAYYQTFWKRRIEFLAGILPNGQDFVGTNLAGVVFSPFGPSASIPYEVGLSGAPTSAPTVEVTLHMTPHFYNQVGIQRALSPASNVFVQNVNVNRIGLNFNVPKAGALWIDEYDYKRFPTIGLPYTWIRFGGIYNNSSYHDYANPAKADKNYSVYLLADRQIWQSDLASDATAYRGLYLGGTAMAAPCSVNSICRYYEVRAYLKGPFASRPKDMIAIVETYQGFSHDVTGPINATSSVTGEIGRQYSNTVTSSYTFNVMHGVYATGAVSYELHPSLTGYRGEGDHALLFLTSLYTAF